MINTWKIHLLTLICFVLGTSQFVVVGILDKIAASTGVSLAAAGQLVTVFSLASAIGTPLVMMAAARMDRRRVLMASLAVVVLGSVATALLPGFAALLGSRALLAIGTGVFYVTSMFVASKLAAPGRQAGAIASIALGFSAALVFGVPLGRLIAASYDWQVLFWGIGVLCLLAIGAVARVIPVTEGEAPVLLGRQLAYLKRPSIAGALAIPFFLFAGYAAVNTYVVPFMTDVSHLGEGELNAALVAIGVASLVGSRLGGHLADRFGVHATLIGGMVLNAMALALVSTVAHSGVVAVPLLMLWSLAAWTAGPTLYSNLISLAPEAAGILMSLNSSVVQLGMAAGAFVGGLVASATMEGVGLTGAAAVTTAIAVAALSFGLAQLSAKRSEVSF